jgi:hypothetical protein
VTPSALVFASFSLSALVGQLSGSLVVSDTTQATVSPAVEGDPLVVAGRTEDIWFIENLPLAELRLSWPESLVTLGYGPRLVLRDPFEDDSTLVVHVVRAGYQYTSRPSRIGIELVGNFGRESLTLPALLPPDTPAPVREPPPLAPGAPPAAPTTPPPEPLELQNPVSALSAALSYAYTVARFELTLSQSVGVSKQSLAGLALVAPLDASGAPAPTLGADATAAELIRSDRVQTFNETTSAGLQYQWTRRLRSPFQLSYAIAGGLGDRAERLVPQIRTASGSAGLTYVISPRDDITTTVVLTQSEVSRGEDASGQDVAGTNHWIVGLTEAWVRRWNADVNSTISVGVTASSSGTDGVEEREESIDPNLAANLFATLYSRRQTTLSAALGATLAPNINGLTGELQTQLGTFAGLGLTVEDTSVNAEATMGQTLPPDDPGAARVITAGAGMSQRVLEFLTLGAQYRSIWQDVEDGDGDGGGNATDPPRLWTATFTLALVGPAIDF